MLNKYLFSVRIKYVTKHNENEKLINEKKPIDDINVFQLFHRTISLHFHSNTTVDSNLDEELNKESLPHIRVLY